MRIARAEASAPDDDAVILERQALHARKIAFEHPSSGEPMEIEAPMPADMQAVLDVLRDRDSAS